jgi:hypothetical protein
MMVDHLNYRARTHRRPGSRQVEEQSRIGVGEHTCTPDGTQVAAARRPLELARVRQLLPAAVTDICDTKTERQRCVALDTVLRGRRRGVILGGSRRYSLRQGLGRRFAVNDADVGVGGVVRAGRGVRGRGDAAALGVLGPLGVLGRGRRGALARAAADGDVAEGSALGPVSPAGLAEVARLRRVVVVVVAELGVPRLAPRARVAGRLVSVRLRLLLLRRRRRRRLVPLRPAEVHARERRRGPAPGLPHAPRGSERAEQEASLRLAWWLPAYGHETEENRRCVCPNTAPLAVAPVSLEFMGTGAGSVEQVPVDSPGPRFYRCAGRPDASPARAVSPAVRRRSAW